MIVVIVCIALLLLGVAGIVRWRNLDVQPPGPPIEAGASVGQVVRRYMWWIAVTMYVTIAVGVLVIGPGGRLAMRILAATAGSSAQGRLTEAEQIVGRITVDGTLGLFIFAGLFFGLAVSALYVLVHRWLPAGLTGGAVYAGALLAIGATRVDPLREDNLDFDIVGPGWLAILIYALMTLLTGLAIAAFAGRISRALPAFSWSPRVVLAYLPVLLPFIGGPPGIVIVLFGLIAVVVTQIPSVLRALRSRRLVLAGRLAVAILIVVSLPGTISALASIAGRP